jgi:hypothetical protein
LTVAQFWEARGGVQKSCAYYPIVRQQLIDYAWTGVKVSIIAHESIINGQTHWRMRLTVDPSTGALRTVFFGPVPIADEQMFLAAVAYYRQACGL